MDWIIYNLSYNIVLIKYVILIIRIVILTHYRKLKLTILIRIISTSTIVKTITLR